ncbi:DUF4142 domain-containing protein [Roseomonas sp. BN140053]|uniref:DUF4142 domain-containing protein n=1 Tax=Roseomonas sp. BN140053 TaxID=3391898 RepID=UPI0039ED5DAB
MFDRRTLTLAIAGGTILAAQSTLVSGVMAQNPASPPGTLTNLDPARVMDMAHAGGSFLLQAARIGMEKAQRPEVKRFAQFEAREQDGIAEAMRIAGHEPGKPTPELPPEKRQAIQRLQTTNGAAFDPAFLEVMNAGHQEALNVFTALQEGNQPPPVKIIALLATNTIREHLILIDTLQNGTR